jgi:hypothetical protein
LRTFDLRYEGGNDIGAENAAGDTSQADEAIQALGGLRGDAIV